MAEPTFLGIGKAEWDLYNSFSSWIAAFATLAAVLVSLYLARRSARPTASVTAGTYIDFTVGGPDKGRKVIQLKIVNTGDRPIRIINIGWRVGIFRKRFATQKFLVLESSPLPVDLTHGQEAFWVVPVDCGDEPWPERFAARMLKPDARSSLLSLRAEFYSSVGIVFRVKPAASLLKILAEAEKRVGAK